MSLPDEQELDWKRPMVSPVAVQSSQTVSHKQPARQGLKLSRDGLKHQLSLRRKLHPNSTLSSQSATDCPSISDAPGPSQRRSRSNGTASEGD